MSQQPKPSSTHDSLDVERTREALFKFLADGRTEHPEHAAVSRAKEPGIQRSEASTTAGFNWSSLLGTGMSAWWQEHPARSVALLLESVTTDYARKKPLQAVTMAAVTGAAIVLLKPWRFVSTTALMLGVFRSSNFTGIASSLLENAAQSIQKEKNQS